MQKKMWLGAFPNSDTVQEKPWKTKGQIKCDYQYNEVENVMKR